LKLVLKANPAPWKNEQLLLQLNNVKDLENWAIGCDKDLGGKDIIRIKFFFLFFYC